MIWVCLATLAGATLAGGETRCLIGVCVAYRIPLHREREGKPWHQRQRENETGARSMPRRSEISYHQPQGAGPGFSES